MSAPETEGLNTKLTRHITPRVARKQCMLADSWQRAELLLDLRSQMNARDWFRLLGKEWESCDSIGWFADEFAEALQGATRAQLDSMMTTAEQRAWTRLPDVINIYRGCYANLNEHGLSWSLSREVASRFPFLARYHHREGTPVLLAALIAKDRTALKLDRNEHEIIVGAPPEEWQISPLADDGRTYA